MGLMDKVKAQASQLAQKTQETARDSMAKFDQAQANRRADAMLRDLGAVIYAERTGRGGADTQAQIEALVADITAHEAEHGISLASQSAEPSGPAAGAGFPGTAAGHPSAPSSGFPAEPAASGFPPEAGADAEFPGAAPGDFQGTAPGEFPGSAPADYPGAAPAPYPPESGGTGFPPESRPAGSAEQRDTGFPPESGSGRG